MKIIGILILATLISNISYTQTVFRFTGNGFWTDNVNWQNNQIPPDTLLYADTIYIQPLQGDSCVLNKQQVLQAGASIIVSNGANFIINNGLHIQSRPKLKRILNPPDTNLLICNTCPPFISQQIDEYYYDSLDRLSKRVITLSRYDFSYHVDTVSILTYTYANNSNKIIGYTDAKSSPFIANHVILYDSINRMVMDSITNPQQGNNKISKFSYANDSIFIFQVQQSIPSGFEIMRDTLILSGGQVIKQLHSGLTRDKELVYNLTAFKNPLSIVNNFSLLSSDNKNGSNSILFHLKNPQFICNSQVSNVVRKNLQPDGTFSFDTEIISITTDVFGNVVQVGSSNNLNRITTFEYY